MSTQVPHLFTVDVEEYFQVHAFGDVVKRQEWDSLPSRVELSTRHLMDLLDEREVRATFFILGWIAERHPDLVREVARRGHEVASHGWWHQRVASQTVDEFRRDVRDAKQILEDVTGREVMGYRAPRFSIVPGTEWALEVLIEEGYRYDSSIVPARCPGEGGFPGAETGPHLLRTDAGTLLELPLATFEWMGLSLPAAGGAYLRHLPYAWVRRALRQWRKAGAPTVFYVHPWELDPDQPRIPVSATDRLRHYRGLDRTEARLRRITADFDFTSVEDWFRLETRPDEDEFERMPVIRKRYGS